MVSRKDENIRNGKPATTAQGQENKLVALAYEVAERQLLAGTASSQVITQLLKTGSEDTRIARLKLEQEVKLAKAKIDQLESQVKIEALYEKAMDAFRGYQPSSEDDIE